MFQTHPIQADADLDEAAKNLLRLEMGFRHVGARLALIKNGGYERV